MTRAEFMKARITLDQDPWNPELEKTRLRWIFSFATEIVNVLKPYVHTRLSSGLEFRGKTGDYVKPHLHIHFDTTTQRKTIIKQLKRIWEKKTDEKFKVRTVYTCKAELFLKSEEQFYRYCWKQYEDLEAIKKHKLLQVGFKDDDIESNRAISHQVWLESREYAQAKQDRYEEESTIYDRCVKVLETLGTEKVLSVEEVNDAIIEQYVKEKKPINIRTIDGYTLTYCIQSGIISKKLISGNVRSRLNIGTQVKKSPSQDWCQV